MAKAGAGKDSEAGLKRLRGLTLVGSMELTAAAAPPSSQRLLGMQEQLTAGAGPGSTTTLDKGPDSRPPVPHPLVVHWLPDHHLVGGSSGDSGGCLHGGLEGGLSLHLLACRAAGGHNIGRGAGNDGGHLCCGEWSGWLGAGLAGCGTDG